MTYSGPKVAPGISGQVLQNIPQQWSAQWFREFCLNYLQYADVRNATAGAGISITGSLGTPAGTIALSTDFGKIFGEPYLLAAAPSDAVLTDYRVIAAEAGVLTVTDGGALSSLTVGVATNGIGANQFRQSAAVSVVGNAANASANVADIAGSGDKSVLHQASTVLSFATIDHTYVSDFAAAVAGAAVTLVALADGSGAPIYSISGSPVTATGTLEFTLATQAQNLVFVGPESGANAQPTFRGLTLADFPSIGSDTVLGNITGGSAVPTALTQAQLTALINEATASLSGTVPAYPNTTTTYLRGDLTWQTLPSGTASANPSATIGLSAVDGSATTFMTSDSAPALSQAITPTWTGQHTFAYTGGPPIKVTQATTSAFGIALANASTHIAGISLAGNGATFDSTDFELYQDGSSIATLFNGANAAMTFYTDGTKRVSIAATGAVTFSEAIGVNGNSPPAQSTGWGTPTGAAVEANFAGASAALATCTAAVAEIITVLKAVGILGA